MTMLLIASAGCKVKAPMLTEVKSVNFKNTESGKVGLVLDLKIKNPNAFALKVKNLNFEVYLNDKVLGKAYSDKKIKINKNSDGYHSIYLETDIDQLKGLMGSLGSLFSQKTEFGLKGKVKCSAGIIPKRFKVDVKTKVNLKDLF
jgi:LEA14-like dessication related protein